MSGKLPSVDTGGRSKEYVERATVLLPEIAKRGGCAEPWTRAGESAAFFKPAYLHEESSPGHSSLR